MKFTATLALDRIRARDSEEDNFAFQCRARKLPAFVRQHRFAKDIGRRWSFDFAFPGSMVAVEIEGVTMRRVNGAWQMGGRHATIDGFREDCIKYASAAMLGWMVLRFEQSQVKQGTAIDYLVRVLVSKGWKPE